jgi:thioredoxin reductase
MDDPWECIIVGGGAAGLSAALVLGRARRLTLVVDAGKQSNLVAEGVGGFLGHDRRPPEALYRTGRDELAAYPSVEIRGGHVVGAIDQGGTFDLGLDDGSRERARRVLLATGMDYRLPEVPGVAERWGRSVFHCPFCHGWEVRDRPLGVLDRGATAVERALLLRLWSLDVTLFTNGAADLNSGDVDRLQRADVGVDERVVGELRGPGSALEAVAFTDGSERRCEGLLVPATLHQRSALAIQLGARVAEPGSVATEALAIDQMFRTSVPGLYAAGDVAMFSAPSVATAVAAGSAAAKTIVHDLLAEAYAFDRMAPGAGTPSR